MEQIIKSFVIKTLDFIFSAFDWVDEDKDMGYIPDCEGYNEQD